MHVVQLNYAYDPTIEEPEELLERYATLTGWSEALLAAGAARVTVVQRFRCDARLMRRGVEYRFCDDGRTAVPRHWTWPRRLHRVVAGLQADVVHVNGMSLPIQTWLLRRALSPSTVLVLQHHSDGFHNDPLRRALRRKGLRAADGFLFAARELAAPWQAAGLITPRQPVYQVMETSTNLRPLPRAAARAAVGLPGDPALLWVGRLNHNKDPLAVLSGFEQALHHLPGAHLTMIYSTDELLPDIEACLRTAPRLAERVHLLGRVPHEALAAFYSAADLFVLGSHREGSGFALIEALACGAVPVVTDIPSFRALTASGRLGALWPPGNPGGLADSLSALAKRDLKSLRVAIQTYFDRELAWPTVGQRAIAAYSELISRRPAGLETPRSSQNSGK